MSVTFTCAARPPCLSRLTAVPGLVPCPIGPEGRTAASSPAQSIQLENVVRGAHQRPLPLHLLEAPQQKLPKASGLFDLAEHRFDHPLPFFVRGPAALRAQLVGHALFRRDVVGEFVGR